MNILIILLLNSLFCIGIYNACNDGMILHFVTKWKINPWISKPLYDCVYCMASVHSIAFALYIGLTWYEWLFYIPILSAANGILYGVFDKLTSEESENEKIKINGFESTENTDH